MTISMLQSFSLKNSLEMHNDSICFNVNYNKDLGIQCQVPNAGIQRDSFLKVNDLQI